MAFSLCPPGDDLSQFPCFTMFKAKIIPPTALGILHISAEPVRPLMIGNLACIFHVRHSFCGKITS